MNDRPFELHNVEEVLEQDGGWLLQRVPESVRQTLESGGQLKARHTPNVEIRFVSDWNHPAEVKLASQGKTRAVLFYGPYQSWEPRNIGTEVTTLTIEPNTRLLGANLSGLPRRSFSPRVARLMLMGDPVILHDVSGPEMRRPTRDELPATRYLAYGSSITHGVSASAPHLTYPSRIARAFGWDVLNLGFRGSALAEPGMADHLAERQDWDVLTLEGSVNMVGRYSADEFYNRWRYFIGRIVEAHPQKPVVVLNMFLHYNDLPTGPNGESGEDVSEAKREKLRQIVRELAAPNLTLLDNEQLLREDTGLTGDLLHPGDDGFEWIARGVIEHFRDRLGMRPEAKAWG